MTIAALIVASGKNAHNAAFDPARNIGTIPAVRRMVMVFQRAGIERIVVTCNEADDRVVKLIANRSVVFLHVSGDAEMLDSVKPGLAYLDSKCDAAIIAHTDTPLFNVETIQALMAGEGQVRLPCFEGKSGHPILVSASLFSDVQSYIGDGGLSGALKELDAHPSLIEVSDIGILANVNREEYSDYFLAPFAPQDVHPAIRIRLVRDQVFYGPGPHQLLQLTDETGSLREACRQMGISYGKGRAMISTMEQQLGYPVIDTQQGGITGGFSVLTDKGRELTRIYDAYHNEAKQYLLNLFEKYFRHS